MQKDQQGPLFRAVGQSREGKAPRFDFNALHSGSPKGVYQYQIIGDATASLANRRSFVAHTQHYISTPN